MHMVWLPEEIYSKEIIQNKKKFMGRNNVSKIFYNIFKKLNKLHVSRQGNS